MEDVLELVEILMEILEEVGVVEEARSDLNVKATHDLIRERVQAVPIKEKKILK